MKNQVLLLIIIISITNSEVCLPNSCYNRGSCIQKNINEIVCICDVEFRGDRCQYSKINCRDPKNKCLSGICFQDHCVCPAAYAGSRCEYENHCQNNPCRDRGKCLSLGNGYKCICDPGYTSNTCEKDINECKQNPGICQNGGICENTEGTFHCRCPAGYNGKLCGFDIDDCDPNPCLNGGRCIDRLNEFKCDCRATFSGTICEVEASDCGCQHGTCNPDLTSCQCDLGWTGYKCDKKITTCTENPCQNGSYANQISNCIEFRDHLNYPQIHCQCADGLTGTYCDKEYDVCLQNPCRGQGDCTSGPGGTYSCACYPGYTTENCEKDINECKDLVPCKNSGACTNTFGSYTCKCLPGFGGFNCEIDIDECHTEPCLNGAKCIDGDNKYTCSCLPGFNGTTCEVEINECESNTCPTYSVCVDKINHYKCICNKGFEDQPNCQKDENECTASLCKNGGSCVDLPGKFRCDCKPGFKGRTCEFDTTPCRVQPCAHGVCRTYENNTLYYCVCDEGFAGRDCEVDIDDCANDPCMNGAECVDQRNDYFCDCPADFTGKNCDLDTRHCLNNPCDNGGSCTPTNLSPYYQCDCAPGYTGTRCRDQKLCEENVCKNGGSCISLGAGRWRCDCVEGFTGDRCQLPLNWCGNRQCYNAGQCVTSGGYPRCQCSAGYTGIQCQNIVENCGDNPCMNGGTCTNKPGGGFMCRCSRGYYGLYCQNINPNPCNKNPCMNGGSCIPSGFTAKCSCPMGFSGKHCEIRSGEDLCNPNPCDEGSTCEAFPPHEPQYYLCCVESSAICLRSDGCPPMCDDSKNNSVCQHECYNAECEADVLDCTQKTEDIDPWLECPIAKCSYLFNNGVCNTECNNPKCNWDGMDCRAISDKKCQYDEYCRNFYNNKYCDQGCNNTECHFDGQDCLDADSPSKTVMNRIELNLNVKCSTVRHFTSQLTYTIDIWLNTISSVDEVIDNDSDPDTCRLIISMDNRYCLSNCISEDLLVLKNFLWANLQVDTKPPFPFQVLAIEDASRIDFNKKEVVLSNAIVISISCIAFVLVIVAVVVARGMIRARAKLWTPDGFRTNRKRSNIKDISTMGDAVHMKGLHHITDQQKFGSYYMHPEQNMQLDMDMDPIYFLSQQSMNKIGTNKPFDDDETAPMITQAAYEFRQREDQLSPSTLAEEQIAVGQQRRVVRQCGRGETPLHVVCRSNNVDELKRLVASCMVEINVKDTQGRTPLYAAVGADATEVLEVLLEVDDIQLDAPTIGMRATPLIFAAKMVYNKCVEMLLKAGANVNYIDSSGRSALHWAAAVNNIQAMELLISHGANKDCTSSKGETPLFLAAREGKLEAVKLLVFHQAARHIADGMDQTPVDVARDRLHTDIEEVLVTWNMDAPIPKGHPGSLTPPQSDDAATGSPNSIPALSPSEIKLQDQSMDCERDENKKGSSKRKKKKTEPTGTTTNNNVNQQTVYQGSYWPKNQTLASPPWLSTQMLSPESLTGSPTSNNAKATGDQLITPTTSHGEQRLSHYPYQNNFPMDTDIVTMARGVVCDPQTLYQHHPEGQVMVPQKQQPQPTMKPYIQLQPVDYHSSSPDSPDEWMSPPNSDWSHTSP